MARPKQFFFEKFISSEYRDNKKVLIPTASISSKGVMFISKTSIELLGETFDLKIVRLFTEPYKKAIGWQFVKEADLEELNNNSLKQLYPKKNNVEKNPWEYYSIPVGKLVDKFGGAELPRKKLEIQSYVDNSAGLHYGKIYFVELK